MICRIIVTHDIFHRCFYMCLCFSSLLFITLSPCSPRKQRRIHKTIYYKSVVVISSILPTPEKELMLFRENVSSNYPPPKCRTFTSFTACKLMPQRKTGCTKAHIVMVGINMMFYSVKLSTDKVPSFNLSSLLLS